MKVIAIEYMYNGCKTLKYKVKENYFEALWTEIQMAGMKERDAVDFLIRNYNAKLKEGADRKHRSIDMLEWEKAEDAVMAKEWLESLGLNAQLLHKR